MGSKNLAHDASWACAAAIMECIENCLREEERREAFLAIAERVKAAMIWYEQAMQREAARLCKPSRN